MFGFLRPKVQPYTPPASVSSWTRSEHPMMLWSRKNDRGQWEHYSYAKPEFNLFTDSIRIRMELGDRIAAVIDDENKGKLWERADPVVTRAVAARPGIPFAEFLGV